MRSLWDEEGCAILTLTEFEGDKEEVAALRVDVMVDTERGVMGVAREEWGERRREFMAGEGRRGKKERMRRSWSAGLIFQH